MEVRNMEGIVQDHERRIVQLERQAEETKNQYLRLENTVLTGNQRQEALLNKVLDHALGVQKTEIEQEHDLNKTRINSRKDIITAVLGGGGIVGVITAVVTYFM